MMLAILLDLQLPKTGAFEIEYTSVTQVALHPHMNEIELLNFTPWRDLVFADGHHEIQIKSSGTFRSQPHLRLKMQSLICSAQLLASPLRRILISKRK